MTKTIMKGRMQKTLPAVLLVALLAILIITQTGCTGKTQEAAEPVSKSGYYLNTTCEISIYGLEEKDAQPILDKAFELLGDEEKVLSRTVDGSDVDRVNKADGAAVEVKQETLEVLELAQEMSQVSEGRFDVTIGGISSMWDFAGEDPHVPKAEAIKKELQHVDYRNLVIEGKTVRLKDGKSRIDLGGVAKGYIADKITELLAEEGVESAIVNLGGNVVTIGSKAQGTRFVIGIERPYSDRTAIIASTPSVDQTLVTSGIYERNFVEEGKLYHHVLDPETGYPVETDLEAVTIIAARGNSGFCDGLSTTCLILGMEKAQALVKNMQEQYPEKELQAVFIDKQDQITYTKGMELNLTEE